MRNICCLFFLCELFSTADFDFQLYNFFVSFCSKFIILFNLITTLKCRFLTRDCLLQLYGFANIYFRFEVSFIIILACGETPTHLMLVKS